MARLWVEKHRGPILKRPAQAVSVPCKRPAAAVSERSGPPGKRQRKEVLPEPSSGPSLTPIDTAIELERACGMRYRREYTDLGLGMQGRGDMPRILADWGYAVKAFVCRSWLKQYRLEGGHIHGNAAVFNLSRTDLRTWYYVDGLTVVQVQEKYLQVHGVYAHHWYLQKWLDAPAQQPERLENDNVSIHSHPACGEYILDRLQNGPRERLPRTGHVKSGTDPAVALQCAGLNFLHLDKRSIQPPVFLIWGKLPGRKNMCGCIHFSTFFRPGSFPQIRKTGGCIDFYQDALNLSPRILGLRMDRHRLSHVRFSLSVLVLRRKTFRRRQRSIVKVSGPDDQGAYRGISPLPRKQCGVSQRVQTRKAALGVLV